MGIRFSCKSLQIGFVLMMTCVDHANHSLQSNSRLKSGKMERVQFVLALLPPPAPPCLIQIPSNSSLTFRKPHVFGVQTECTMHNFHIYA